jgi:hypothetical protein
MGKMDWIGIAKGLGMDILIHKDNTYAKGHIMGLLLWVVF